MEPGYRRGRRFVRREDWIRQPSATYQRLATQRQRAVRERRERVLSWAERHVFGIIVVASAVSLMFGIVLVAYLYQQLTWDMVRPVMTALAAMGLSYAIPWRRMANQLSQFATPPPPP